MNYFEKDVIESLQDLLEDGFSELVTTFIGDGERRLGIIETAISSSDIETISHEAHGLKGSCQNIGALALADVAAKIEKQTRSGDDRNLDQQFATLQQLFAATAEELRTL